MPVFDTLDGIIISVFSCEHLPPHCHAQYAEHEALIAIRTCEVIAGRLPTKSLKKVIAFVEREENQLDLLETFYRLNPHIKRI